MENFLFNTSSALASSWKPMAARGPCDGAAAETPPVARGLLVALLLLPADGFALLGSESDGVGWSSAERLALLLDPPRLTAGGDRESALGGGVEACGSVGRGPGMLLPGPGAGGWYCSGCIRGDSSLIRTCARYGEE